MGTYTAAAVNRGPWAIKTQIAVCDQWHLKFSNFCENLPTALGWVCEHFYDGGNCRTHRGPKLLLFDIVTTHNNQMSLVKHGMARYDLLRPLDCEPCNLFASAVRPPLGALQRRHPMSQWGEKHTKRIKAQPADAVSAPTAQKSNACFKPSLCLFHIAWRLGVYQW